VRTCRTCGEANPPDARFCGQCGSPLADSCERCGAELPGGVRFCPSCGAPVAEPLGAGEERKVVTVLFSDVAGSTGLGERLDPERLKDVMGAYFEAMAREIEARGIPTLILSASPAATESVRPPRAMTFDGSEIGRIVGRAGDRATHKRVVRTALEMFTHDTPPGKVVSKRI